MRHGIYALLLAGAVLSNTPVLAQVSDDFSGSSLDAALWTLVDPMGDGAVVQSDGVLELTVPAGTEHDLWRNGNAALRAMQPVGDVDFELEAKFESLPASGYQIQGILVEQAPGTYVRFDTYHSGSSLNVFAATMVNDSPTVHGNAAISVSGGNLWMRLRRVGTTWSAETSQNGVDWASAFIFTSSVVPSAAGVYAGNAGANPPAHTAVVDYFFDTAAPIDPEDGEVVADTTPPVITSTSASADEASAAIAWTTDEFTTGTVAWGTSAALAGGAVTSASLATAHGVTLAGLTPGTPHFWQVTATDGSGNVAQSAILEFSTAEADTSTSSGAVVVSDDFSGAAIDAGLWTVVDPMADGAVVQNDGRLRLTVPAGTSHDLWSSGNDALRVVQPIADTDFEIEAKFESVPSEGYQIQGILVEESPGTYVRFDTYHSGANLNLFAATFQNDSPTVRGNTSLLVGDAQVWLRLRRTATAWQARVSTDGITWTTAFEFTSSIVPSAAGVHAGNAGANPPAFTAVVDYVFDTSAPIVPEDGQIAVDTTPPVIADASAVVTDVAAALSWTTDEFSTSSVAYGATPSLESGSIASEGTSTSHAVDLGGLASQTDYYWQITATDGAGNAAQGTLLQFTTAAADTVTAPTAVLTSDDFSGATFDAQLWTVVDAVGDGSVTQSGGRLELTVPAGTAHDLWRSGNDALRVVQSAADVDFEIEAKFESVPSQGYQIQGILVEQVPGTYLRFDTYHTGSSLNVFAATFSNDAPTIRGNQTLTAVTDTVWLRLRRTGTTWEGLYSTDGAAWTTAFTFTSSLVPQVAGVHAGNAGANPPAFTAVVDYVFDTSAPIDPEDGDIAVDTTPPVIAEANAVATDVAVALSWTTDEFSFGSVAYGTTDSLEAGVVPTGSTATSHAIELTGLTPDTPYFWRITATDGSGNAADSPLLQFTTAPSDTMPPPAGVFVSDDFSDGVFDDAVWTVVDPLGDGLVIESSGVLEMIVPGGAPHDLWKDGNDALRVVQSVGDEDFEMEARFESVPDQAYQIQGIVVEQAPGTYLRFDTFFDGVGLNIFAATFSGDNPTIRGNLALKSQPEDIWMRVRRTGTSYETSYSLDGTNWSTAFAFKSGLTPGLVGVYAGTAGGEPPAFRCVVDYAFDTATPIDPEDENVFDLTPPTLLDLSVAPDPGAGTATITFGTTEPASASIAYGGTSAYGLEVTDPVLRTDHVIELTGLVEGASYHFAATVTDTAGNAFTTPDDVFDQVGPPEPTVVIWHGLDQRVGHLGAAQTDFNVMGNVSPIAELQSLSYRLNGALPVAMNWGDRPDGFGDGRRLASTGDFNADIPISELQPGVNVVDIRAENVFGGVTTASMTVTLENGSSTLPTSIDWSAVADPQDVGQYVDGQWLGTGSGLRTGRTGYDRLFLIGDETWQDYEIVVPITINEVVSPTSEIAGPQGLGFVMRFTGHVVGGYRNWPDAQPKWGYQPFGAIGWLRWRSGPDASPTKQFYRGDYDIVENKGLARENGDLPAAPPEFGADTAPTTDFGLARVAAGETHWMRMRCETLPDAANGDGVTAYSFKIWGDAEAEPVEWAWEVVQTSEFALRQGGVAFVAHNVDATFGNVEITSVTPSVAIAGDVDRSGELDIADATLVLDQLVGSAQLDVVPAAVGDVDGSRSLDSFDASLIAEQAATGGMTIDEPHLERPAEPAFAWDAAPAGEGRLTLRLKPVAGAAPHRSGMVDLTAHGLGDAVESIRTPGAPEALLRWKGDGDRLRIAFAATRVIGHDDDDAVIEIVLDTAGLQDGETLAGSVRLDAGSTVELSPENLATVPRVFALGANRPNPFNPSTTIAFDLPKDSRVRLQVFDLRGRLVRALVDEELRFGRHTVVWHGRDDRGQRVASGVYFYRFETPEFSDVRKMTLVK